MCVCVFVCKILRSEVHEITVSQNSFHPTPFIPAILKGTTQSKRYLYKARQTPVLPKEL